MSKFFKTNIFIYSCYFLSNIITFLINRAIIRKCNNALYPDLYGHYREAKFTQTKHHWWWKANRVFDQLDVTRYHTGQLHFKFTKKIKNKYIKSKNVYRSGFVPRGRSLCSRRFSLSARNDAVICWKSVSAVRYTIIGYISKNFQLLHL